MGIKSQLKYTPAVIGQTQGGYPPVDWIAPENIVGLGNSTDCSTSDTSRLTEQIYVQDWDFDIPANARILGITVNVLRKASQAGVQSYVIDEKIILLKNDIEVGDDKKDIVTKWPLVYINVAYGGEDDIWGENWTPDDINNALFGFRIQASLLTTFGEGVTAYIQRVFMEVDYITPDEQFMGFMG